MSITAARQSLASSSQLPENWINDTFPSELLFRIFEFAQTPVVRSICRKWKDESKHLFKQLEDRLCSIPEIAAIQATSNTSFQRCQERWKPFQLTLRAYDLTPPKNILALSLSEFQQIAAKLQVQRDISLIFFCRKFLPIFIQNDFIEVLDDQLISVSVKADLLRSRLKTNERVKAITHLEIDRSNLETVPKEIEYFSSLTLINLSNNRLLFLPKELARLPLQCLWISNNKLSDLPIEQGSFSHLSELHIEGNEFASLPPSLLNIPHLYQLFISRRNTQSQEDKLLIETLVAKKNLYITIKD